MWIFYIVINEPGLLGQMADSGSGARNVEWMWNISSNKNILTKKERKKKKKKKKKKMKRKKESFQRPHWVIQKHPGAEISKLPLAKNGAIWASIWVNDYNSLCTCAMCPPYCWQIFELFPVFSSHEQCYYEYTSILIHTDTSFSRIYPE